MKGNNVRETETIHQSLGAVTEKAPGCDGAQQPSCPNSQTTTHLVFACEQQTKVPSNPASLSVTSALQRCHLQQSRPCCRIFAAKALALLHALTLTSCHSRWVFAVPVVVYSIVGDSWGMSARVARNGSKTDNSFLHLSNAPQSHYCCTRIFTSLKAHITPNSMYEGAKADKAAACMRCNGVLLVIKRQSISRAPSKSAQAGPFSSRHHRQKRQSLACLLCAGRQVFCSRKQ